MIKSKLIVGLNDMFDIILLIDEFIKLLEITEETDEGKIFWPNYISSCRTLDAKRMKEIIAQLKELIE